MRKCTVTEYHATKHRDFAARTLDSPVAPPLPRPVSIRLRDELGVPTAIGQLLLEPDVYF